MKSNIVIEKALMLLTEEIHIPSIVVTTLDEAFRFLLVPKNPVFGIRALWRMLDSIGSQASEMLYQVGHYNSALVSLVEMDNDLRDLNFILTETEMKFALWMEWDDRVIPLLSKCKSYHSICDKQIEFMRCISNNVSEVTIRGIDADGRLCSATFAEECGEYCRVKRP